MLSQNTQFQNFILGSSITLLNIISQTKYENGKIVYVTILIKHLQILIYEIELKGKAYLKSFLSQALTIQPLEISSSQTKV